LPDKRIDTKDGPLDLIGSHWRLRSGLVMVLRGEKIREKENRKPLL